MSKIGKLVGVCNGTRHCGLTDCFVEHDLVCEHTQQKDAGENKRIEQILMEHDGDDCLREDIQQLVTQARAEAFHEGYQKAKEEYDK